MSAHPFIATVGAATDTSAFASGAVEAARARLLGAPLRDAEFLVVDTETNGLSGESCEMTEIGAVLVGGGELHERWASLSRCGAPLRRGIQRFTGITQAMLDGAPGLEQVLPDFAARLEGRVLVAHNAPFDRRVLRQAFGRIGLPWPDPPVICTAALARTMLPLQRKRGLGVLADALGIEVDLAHRALADAETCARVLCALFPRLCAHAATVADALEVLAPRRRARARRPDARLGRGASGGGRGGPAGGSGSRGAGVRPGAGVSGVGVRSGVGASGVGVRSGTGVSGAGVRSRAAGSRGALPGPEFGELPSDPGVYIFRDAAGEVLYVGKSVSIRSRARAHFAPSAPPAAWTDHAAVVDYRTTISELGALVLENRLIKQYRPPGNTRLTRRDDRLVYVRCRLDIAFPILEVAAEPAAGHAVSIGPVRGRGLAAELVEQLDSLFGLRHCGRTLPRRTHPSAYGQMGRCLSPCLGDLDPNLYRRRIDAVLGLFATGDAASPLLDHIEREMRRAADARRYEQAASLRRRRGRLATILARLDGLLEATHARPRLVLAAHPVDPARREAFWLSGGRLVDSGPLPEDPEELARRSDAALARAGRVGEVGAHVPPDEVDELRIIGSYLASHADLEQRPLR